MYTEFVFIGLVYIDYHVFNMKIKYLVKLKVGFQGSCVYTHICDLFMNLYFMYSESLSCEQNILSNVVMFVCVCNIEKKLD